jgi:putative Mg2+ transporter-C (MgtC) family protein
MPPTQMIEGADQLMQVLPAFLVRCGVAVVCGALIGIERELKRKPAGFRTNILICLGASIYMATGLLLRDGDQVDPTRIAAQVVTGIGFLGAGCIIQAGRQVTGLTSAATIWVVASIGILAGAGFPILALTASALVLITLAVLGGVERRAFSRQEVDDYRTPNGRAS